MTDGTIYLAGKTPAIGFAGQYLRKYGYAVSNSLARDTTHIVLDVPSFRPDGALRWGEDAKCFWQNIPQGITVVGGNLAGYIPRGYPYVDILQDEEYLARNAYITAECAIKSAFPHLFTTLRETPTLVLGWGRIGKCLASILKAWNVPVTVTARKISDLAALHALGYHAVNTGDAIHPDKPYRLVFNTIPAPVPDREQIAAWDGCIQIDLASSQGLAGEDVIWARGLPGISAPESSGKLIAETVIRLCKEEST